VKRLAAWFGLLCLLALSGCSQPADDIIRMGLASAPSNLDPRFATDATSARLNRLLYARLVDFDENLLPVPALAEWEQLAANHYRFRLRPERATFHDGTVLTARDVAATYRHILDPANGSPQRSALQLIERIAVLDGVTLDFHLARPDPLFPGYLVIGILPEAGILTRQPFHEAPLGSGPFRFDSWPEPGRVRLQRLRDGQIIEFQRIADSTVRILKLLRGEVDLLQNDLSAEMLDYMQQQPGISIGYGTGSNFAYLGFNLQDPVTGDLRVRQAVAHAIDRRAIIAHVLGDAARLAAALLPPDHWAGNPDLQPIAYAPQRARALLREAGYTDEAPLELRFKTSTDPLRIRIATVIQDQLRQVGIDMKLQSYDWGTFYGDIKAGRFQLYSLAWVGIKTPDIFRYAFHSTSLPPAGANRGRLSDKQVDRLIEAAEQARTIEAQAAAFRRVQARLLDILPYVPLWYEDHVYAIRNDLIGYRLAADGNYDALNDVHRKSWTRRGDQRDTPAAVSSGNAAAP
jgi:peptide/nickel transport system substrate-binding protein